MKNSFIKYFTYSSLALLLALSLVYLFKPKYQPVEVTQVIAETFIESISAEGRIRSQQKERLLAFNSGNSTGITVRVGESVKKGQVLTTILSDNTQSVRSPIDGIVAKVYKESPSPVTRGEPLLDIINPHQLEVVTELLTSDSVKIKVGSAAQISGWGGDSPLTGQVSLVSKAGFTKVSALGVEEERTEVKISLSNVPDDLLAKLGDNFHVDVSITISETPDAKTLPLGAVFKSRDEWFVYKVENKKAVLQKVTINKRNDKKALIESGLNIGETIILFPGDKIKPDTLVRATN